MAERFTHAQLLRRHGLRAYSRFCVARLLRRFWGIELCIISVSDISADYPLANGFRIECLHKDVIHKSTDPAKLALDEFSVTHARTLAKGHHAVVTIDSNSQHVVGHNFYARSATAVNDDVFFNPEVHTFILTVLTLILAIEVADCHRPDGPGFANGV